MNVIRQEEGISKLIQQLTEEKLIPVFGAGFSAKAEALSGVVPDGNLASKMMKKIETRRGFAGSRYSSWKAATGCTEAAGLWSCHRQSGIFCCGYKSS